MSEAAGLFKKACPEPFEGFVQSCPEPCRREGRSQFSARSVLPVREHGKLATCLREAATAACAPKLASAASAKAGNAAGGLFQQPLSETQETSSFREMEEEECELGGMLTSRPGSHATQVAWATPDT